jgi:hypothetical protein
MTPDSMVEKVARALCEQAKQPVDVGYRAWMPYARAAIKAALPLIAEEMAGIAQGWLDTDFDESANVMAQNIRDDIRARASEIGEGL